MCGIVGARDDWLRSRGQLPDAALSAAVAALAWRGEDDQGVRRAGGEHQRGRRGRKGSQDPQAPLPRVCEATDELKGVVKAATHFGALAKRAKKKRESMAGHQHELYKEIKRLELLEKLGVSEKEGAGAGASGG